MCVCVGGGGGGGAGGEKFCVFRGQYTVHENLAHKNYAYIAYVQIELHGNLIVLQHVSAAAFLS